MKFLPKLSAVLVILSLSGPALAKKDPPAGIVAASAGTRLFLVNPATGAAKALEVGKVAWLFPAPGGILFAPDLTRGRTTVVDLRNQSVTGRLDGVTMPHFGEATDRYIVVAGKILLVSWPGRALLGEVPAEIRHPWQVIVLPGDLQLLVLERRHDGRGGVRLWLVDLLERRVIRKIDLDPEVRSMVPVPALGMLALAEGPKGVHMLAGGSFETVAVIPVAGSAEGVAAGGSSGRTLAVAVADGPGGRLERHRLRSRKGELTWKSWESLALPAPPVLVAGSPDGAWVAVALGDGHLGIAGMKEGPEVASAQLPSAPRDLVWCDPGRRGPPAPHWSVQDDGTYSTAPTPSLHPTPWHGGS